MKRTHHFIREAGEINVILKRLVLFLIGSITGAWLLSKFTTEVALLNSITLAVYSLILGFLVVHTVILVVDVSWYHLKSKMKLNNILGILFLAGFFLSFCGLMSIVEGDVRNFSILSSIGIVLCLTGASRLILLGLGVMRALLFGMEIPKSES